MLVKLFYMLHKLPISSRIGSSKDVQVINFSCKFADGARLFAQNRRQVNLFKQALL